MVRKILQQEVAEAPAEATRLGRDHEKFLLALLESTAMQKFEESRKQEVTFADACRFWSITENMKGEALDARLTQFEATLAGLDRELAQADAELSNGRAVSAGDLRVLSNIHRYMEDRFGRHLNLLRSRSGKR
jgi:hypothetical protein